MSWEGIPPFSAFRWSYGQMLASSKVSQWIHWDSINLNFLFCFGELWKVDGTPHGGEFQLRGDVFMARRLWRRRRRTVKLLFWVEGGGGGTTRFAVRTNCSVSESNGSRKQSAQFLCTKLVNFAPFGSLEKCDNIVWIFLRPCVNVARNQYENEEEKRHFALKLECHLLSTLTFICDRGARNSCMKIRETCVATVIPECSVACFGTHVHKFYVRRTNILSELLSRQSCDL